MLQLWRLVKDNMLSIAQAGSRGVAELIEHGHRLHYFHKFDRALFEITETNRSTQKGRWAISGAHPLQRGGESLQLLFLPHLHLLKPKIQC